MVGVEALPGQEVVARETLEAIRAVASEWARSRALRGLAPRLPESLKPAALAEAHRLSLPGARARALTGLAAGLVGQAREAALEAALAAARLVPDGGAQELIALVPHLTGDVRLETARAALAQLGAQPDPYSRAWCLADLAPHLPAGLKADLVARARAIEDVEARLWALSAIFAWLPESWRADVLEQALTQARGLQDDGARAQALAAWVEHLPPEARPEAARSVLAWARACAEDGPRLRALYALGPHLAGGLGAEALACARDMREPALRAEALSALAARLPAGGEQETAARAALEAALAVEDDWPRASALGMLAARLPEDAWPAALEAALAVEDDWPRASVLSNLARSLPDGLRQQAQRAALQAARSADGPWACARALTAVMGCLPPEAPAAAPEMTREQVLAALEAVKDPEIPLVSVVEMGLVAGVDVAPGRVRVALTPTFAGCPAVEVMRHESEMRLRALGVPEVKVDITFDPPWTSDRLTEAGRRKLKEFGLAPPRPRAESASGLIQLEFADCPYCGSADTVLESAFGPTLCRAIHYCRACRQSFEQFKPVW